jgi:hypothetical protein
MTVRQRILSRYTDLTAQVKTERRLAAERLRHQTIRQVCLVTGEAEEDLTVGGDTVHVEDLVFRWNIYWSQLELQSVCPYCHGVVWRAIGSADDLAMAIGSAEWGLVDAHKHGYCRA